jgi:arsenate reductase
MTKMIVAFICTHNACRSQIAEALAKHAGINHCEFYSAGSIPDNVIDPNAVRIMKDHFNIDMSSQYPKTVDDIPMPDIAISMGCGVKCPYIGRSFDDDWGLEDPMGKSDDDYLAVITKIQPHVNQLSALIQAEKTRKKTDH